MIGYTGHMSASDPIAELEAAIALPNTSVIVRSDAAIAEVRGPLPLRRSAEWLTIGEEASSHVHLRQRDVARCRFVVVEAANARLEVLDAAGATLCKVSFRHTNPAREDRYDSQYAADVRKRFEHLA